MPRSQFLGGVFGQGAGLLSTLLIQLLQVPIFISVLGDVGYGQYLLAIAVPSLLVLSDFGVLAAFSTAMLLAVAAKDYGEARRLSMLASGTLACLAIVVLLGLGAWLLIFPTFGGLPAWAPTVFFFYGVYALINLQTNAIEGILRADGRQAMAWSVIAALRLVEFFVAALTLVLTQSIVAFVFALVATRLAGTVLLSLRRAALVTWASRRPSLKSWKDHRTLVRPMIGSLAQPATNYIYLQGTILLVGALFGPASVAQLSVLRTLAGVLKQGSQAVLMAGLPLLTRASASGDYSNLRARRHSTTRVTLVGLLPLAGIVVLLGPLFVEQWTHGQVEVNIYTTLVFVLAAVADVVLGLATMTLVARNLHLRVALIGLAASAIYIAVARFVANMSLESIVWVQITAVLITAVIAVILTRREERHEG